MKIKTKLTLSAFSIAAVAVATVAVLLTGTATRKVEAGLSLARSDQMTSLLHSTATSVEQYANSLTNQLLDMAGQQTVALATEDMGGSYGAYALFAGQKRIPEHREAVLAHYQSEYLERFSALNNGATVPVADWVTQLSDNAATLQSHFIAANPEPYDQRATMDSAAVNSSYNTYHQRYHPQIRRFQQRFGLDDILLVDAERQAVIYSVRKDPDFGTSLQGGPFEASHLADTVEKALSAGAGQAVFSDFSPYLPDLNRPVAFMASTILNQEGNTVGVLVFRLSVDRLNQLASYNMEWEASGLGETGSTFLVGPDGTARTNSRLLLENPERYQTRLAEADHDSSELATILAMGTDVARRSLLTPQVKRALNGEQGTEITRNIWGDRVISAFAPIEMFGQRWAVVSEIHQDEALAELVNLTRSIQGLALISALVLAALAAVAGLWLARSITQPLVGTVRTLDAIADGDGDLTQRLNEDRRDELGDLARAFNRFVRKIHDIVVHVKDVNGQLLTSTGEVQDRAHQAIQSLADQNLQTDQVSTAMTEMAASIEDVARHATEADQLSRETHQLAQTGVAGVNDLADTVRHMDDQTRQVTDAIQRLNNQSDSIGTILDVIRSIAEQTNLLALNAAIEAARAGEHGRGFAVVADEVRTLANRTQQSTEEIHQMIEGLQSGSGEAVNAIEAGRKAVADGVTKAEAARDTLNRIANAMDHIQDANVSIASVVEEQSRVAHEINESLLHIKQVADHTSQGSEEIGDSVTTLSKLNQQLQGLVGRFRTMG